MHPVLLRAGSLTLYTYGLALVAAGFLAVGWGARQLERRRGVDPWVTLEAGVAALVAGTLAAHLAGRVLGQAGPGLARSAGYVQAGIAAGLVAVLVVFRRHRLPLLATTDAAVECLPLGLAAGRLGCLAAGCCYGRPTALPWGLAYLSPEAHSLTGVPLGIALHPAPLYLAAGELVVLLLVHRVAGAMRPAGTALACFFLAEGSLRAAIEPFRADPRFWIGRWPVGAVAGLAMAALGGLGLAIRIRAGRAGRRGGDSGR